MLTCSNNQFELMYYYLPVNQTFGNIWAGQEGTTLDPGENWEFDIEVGVSAEEAVIYREWLAVTAFIDYYEW
jgi:hypothetical protein